MKSLLTALKEGEMQPEELIGSLVGVKTPRLDKMELIFEVNCERYKLSLFLDFRIGEGIG